MRRIANLVLPVLVAACTGGSSSTASSTDSADDSAASQMRFTDGNDSALALQLSCAVSNGMIRVGVYDRESFDPAAFKQELTALDADRGCPGRIRSASKADAIKSATAFTKELVSNNLVTELDTCLVDADLGGTFANPDEYVTQLMSLVADDANVAVFSTDHDPKGKDDPVACFYFRYVVFRDNGTVIDFDYDFGD